MKRDYPIQGPISGTQCSEPPSSDGTPSPRGKGFREPLGENAVEQLRQYQVITLPPSARRALLGAQLPGASPELLYDTLPPHFAVQHGDPDPLGERESPSLGLSRQRKRRAIVVVVAIALALAALMAALLVVDSGPQPSPDTPAATKSPPRAAPPRPAAPPQPAPVVEQAPTDLAPRKNALITPEKSATGPRLQPTKEPSVTASAAPPRTTPPGTTSADAVSVPAPAPSAHTGRKFRLGSR